MFFEAQHLINGNFDDIFYQEVNNIYEQIITDDIEPPEDTPYHRNNLYQNITTAELKRAMKSNGKSVDNFEFHPTMFQHLGDKAIATLEKLFNLCLTTHQWVWEGAEVIFLRKEGKDSVFTSCICMYLRCCFLTNF